MVYKCPKTEGENAVPEENENGFANRGVKRTRISEKIWKMKDNSGEMTRKKER